MKKTIILILILIAFSTNSLFADKIMSLAGGVLFPMKAYYSGDLRYAMFGSLYNGYCFNKPGYDLNLKYITGSTYRLFLKFNYNNVKNEYSEQFPDVAGTTKIKASSEIWGYGIGIECKFLDILLNRFKVIPDINEIETKTPQIEPYLFFGCDINHLYMGYFATNPPPGALSLLNIDPCYRLGINLGLGVDYYISKNIILNMELVYVKFDYPSYDSKSPAFLNKNTRYLNDGIDGDIPGDAIREIDGFRVTLGIGYSFER